MGGELQADGTSFWLAFETDDGQLVVLASTDLDVNDTDDGDLGLLGRVAQGFHEAHPNQRLVFVADLTRWLASAGLVWDDLDLDVQEVLVDCAGASKCDRSLWVKRGLTVETIASLRKSLEAGAIVRCLRERYSDSRR